MLFEHINSKKNYYTKIVLGIIEIGIKNGKDSLNKDQIENYKNQKLAEIFNILGTTNEKLWIGAATENIKSKKNTKEDIYFYLNDEKKTRVFFVEGKRLPKVGKVDEEEYVTGLSSTGNESGGIERYKIGKHGDPNPGSQNAIIGYVERESIKYWREKISNKIQAEWGNDTILTAEADRDIFKSTHLYDSSKCNVEGSFIMYHFFIDLSIN